MIYEFFTSRNNGANVSTYVGQAGRLFYDGTNGVLKLSDGITPGGANIQLPVATTTLLGGIKAGPGANVSVDGTLTINTAGLPLSFGNLTAVDNTLSTVNANADLILASNGTGNVELFGNIHFHTTASPTSIPFFTANNDGQITILVPASDPLAGAVKIVGSQTGRVSPPNNTGVMLQLTGNNNDPSRLYNDGIGSFAAFVGRRINGNLTVPTAVTAGQEIIRISATGYNGTTTPGSAGARINFAATENYTNSNFGSNIGFWACPTGSNVLVKQATIDGQSGLTATKFTGPLTGNVTGDTTGTHTGNVIGNLTGNVTGNVSGSAGSVAAANITGTTLAATVVTSSLTTVGTLGSLTVTNQITAKNYSGLSRDAGTLGAAGTLTIDFATDHNVLVNLTTTATIAFANITAGKTVTVMVKNNTGANRAITLGVIGLNTSGGNPAPNVNDVRTGVFVYRTFGTATTDVYCEVN